MNFKILVFVLVSRLEPQFQKVFLCRVKLGKNNTNSKKTISERKNVGKYSELKSNIIKFG